MPCQRWINSVVFRRTFRDRLMAGQKTLNLFILVRIQVPEPQDGRRESVFLPFWISSLSRRRPVGILVGPETGAYPVAVCAVPNASALSALFNEKTFGRGGRASFPFQAKTPARGVRREGRERRGSDRPRDWSLRRG